MGAIALGSSAVRAADWPAYQHDNHRSATSAEKIDAAQLGQAWTWRSPHPPRPAWPGPAKWDAYAGIRDLSSMRNYDPVFHTTVAGDKLFFGSSVDDSVHCFSTKTGQRLWQFTTDGPVRIAPSVVGDRVYFGSDDGFAYCVSTDGQLFWRFSPKPDDRLVLNDGRLISFWPVRTGVLVDGGTAYFSASMLPWRPSYLCAVDAATGKPEGDGRYVREMKDSNTFEGPLLATAEHVFVPQGRIPPMMFERKSGRALGALDGAGGGCFAVITPDNQIIHGPGNRKGQLVASSAKSRAKVAAHPAGKSMIVTRDLAFVMRTKSITATDRKSGGQRWLAAGGPFLSMIATADCVFAGGFDEVLALDAVTGKELWRGEVFGKAHGLAVADGALFVSTDEGEISCFRPGAAQDRKIVGQSPAVELNTLPVEPVKKVAPFADPALVGRWVFHASEMRNSRGTQPKSNQLRGIQVNDQGGKLTGTVLGNGELQRVGALEVLKLDGATASVLLTDDHTKANLPIGAITAEAWVRIDAAQQWGGILGAIQDNGNFERGWILGYSGSKFSFGVNATDGRDAITYLPAKTDFTNGRWYHVAGTFDGKVLKVYVNGHLENTATDQQGDIKYPPKTFVEIGAYHDKDEYFRLNGMLHEARLYSRALSADEIEANFKTRQADFPTAPKSADPYQPAVGPWLTFFDRSTALVRWRTSQALPTVLEYALDGKSRQIVQPNPTHDHTARLTGLKRDRTYRYTIRTAAEGGKQSRAYECDTAFNYSTPTVDSTPKSRPQYAAAAGQILKGSGIDRGICVVMGMDGGELAIELAHKTQLRIVCVDTDPKQIAKVRETLQQIGLYGARVSAITVESLDDLPLPGGFANLVVSESVISAGKLPSAAEVHRLLRPGGGLAYMGQPAAVKKRISNKLVDDWLVSAKLKGAMSIDDDGIWVSVQRPRLVGAGSWTHQYGSADNSAFGGEQLAGSSETSQFIVQWFGRPGPRFQPDRNGRKPGPLAVNGRLFAQGLNRIVALDSHNGVVIWSAEIPDMLRMNMPRDSSNWCADKDSVYVAIRDKCWRLRAADGARDKLYDVPTGPNADWQYDWSYIASHGKLLVGSAVKKDTAFKGFWGKNDWYDAPHGPQTDKVCSESVFALDKKTGRKVWQYSDGVVLNSTLTIGGDRVYLVECRNSKVKTAQTRRIGMGELWQDQFLVALDAKTGEKYWEKPLDTHDGVTLFSMAHAQQQLVISSSGGGAYHVYTFKTDDGSPLWNHRFGWPGGKHDHGKAMSRPAIAGNKLYVRPHVFELATGKVLPAKVPSGGCGTYACAGDNLFFRNGNVTMWNAKTNATTSWSRLRPGCWLSTIAADGMLLSPEAGGGCSCGNWLETSISFAPGPAKSSTDK
jgi:outer membrane protein assembly factor BamB